jgi:hypothetical protein
VSLQYHVKLAPGDVATHGAPARRPRGIGTCGSLQRRARVGDIAIFDSAIRADGSSEPIERPARVGCETAGILDERDRAGSTGTS